MTHFLNISDISSAAIETILQRAVDLQTDDSQVLAGTSIE